MRCVALAFLVSLSTTAAAVDWDVRTSVDPMDDSVRVVAATETTYSGRHMIQLATLMVRCWRGSLDVILVPDLFLMRQAQVRVRFDDQAAFRISAGRSTTNQALFLRSDRLITELQARHSALFEITNLGRRTLIEFSLAGSAAAIRQPLEACGWAESHERRLQEEEAQLAREVERTQRRSTRDWANQIRRAWTRPPGTADGLEVIVRVRLLSDGEVQSIEVQRSSGDSAFDRSVEQAIRRASPLQVPDDSEAFRRAGLDSVTFRFSPDG